MVYTTRKRQTVLDLHAPVIRLCYSEVWSVKSDSVVSLAMTLLLTLVKVIEDVSFSE